MPFGTMAAGFMRNPAHDRGGRMEAMAQLMMCDVWPLEAGSAKKCGPASKSMGLT